MNQSEIFAIVVNLTVCSGDEGLLTRLRAYVYIGAEVLVQKVYILDFSAKV